jgi:uncharacterized protein
MAHVLRSFLPLLLGMSLLGCDEGRADRCFLPGTTLPQRAQVLGDRALGASARALAEALFDRDAGTAAKLLQQDRALARTAVGGHHDMLVVALATCDRSLVDLLLREGAPADGVHPRIPLAIALRAEDPWFALRLLEAGASPKPAPDGSVDPLRSAIELNSAGAVRMLLDHGADSNQEDALGGRPLQAALDMDHFALAELLLDRGADPWAVDSGGGSLGWSATQPMVRNDASEAAAQRRLADRARRLGWPQPAPDPHKVRELALAGKWPKPISPTALKVMRENASR